MGETENSGILPAPAEETRVATVTPEDAEKAAARCASHAPRRRGHHRAVVRKGRELFEEDGSDLGLSPRDMIPPDVAVPVDDEGAADGDDRILSELPPHWGVYSEREESGA